MTSTPQPSAQSVALGKEALAFFAAMFPEWRPLGHRRQVRGGYNLASPSSMHRLGRHHHPNASTTASSLISLIARLPNESS